MVILGIDPGYAITGYGVIAYLGNKLKPLDYGRIATPSSMPFSIVCWLSSRESKR